jgi:ABC-type sugar transport system permease subunit
MVTGAIWSWLYGPGREVINTVLRSIGLEADFRYATNPNTAIYWWNEFFLALSLVSRATQTVQVIMAEAKGTTLVLYNL